MKTEKQIRVNHLEIFHPNWKSLSRQEIVFLKIGTVRCQFVISGLNGFSVLLLGRFPTGLWAADFPRDKMRKSPAAPHNNTPPITREPAAFSHNTNDPENIS